jgi:hypothetical protein
MRPDQCGSSGRPLTAGDREVVDWFRSILPDLHAARAHEDRVADIMAGRVRLELLSGTPYHRDDFVKVVTGPQRGRWGKVTEVHDFRHRRRELEFVVMVSLLTVRDSEVVAHPPHAQPFEPEELSPLWGTDGGPGDWVKRGRVLRPLNWPRARTGHTEAS